jgi:amino acid adenylation domain-containing protein
MIPAAFVFLDALPVNPNGKLDRKALPEPEWGGGEEGYAAPRTPVEEVLAGTWAEVLGVERVGVHDGFFDLGGHSLLATRVVSRVRELFGVELPLRALFEGPTVAELAGRVEAARREGAGVQAPPIVPVPRDGSPLPLSFAQARLWFIDQLEPGSATYNIPVPLWVSGAVDARVLAGALSELVRRHEALRTVFRSTAGEPVQVVLPPAPVPLPSVDLRALSPESREVETRRLAAEDAARPFDLARGPLLRTTLVRSGVGEHALLVNMHHVVSDGWSMGVLFRELSVLYEAFAAGASSPLPELPVQYADFAVWQRAWLSGETLEEQVGYWKQELGGAPPLLEVPTDRPRAPGQSARGRTHPFVVSAEAARGLRALSRREGTTLFMTVLTAWQALLGRYAGQADVVVGSPIAGRTRAELEGLIGFFVNMLVLRADLGGDPTWAELVGRTRRAALGAYAHQDVPFERLVDELAPERSLTHAPLFQVTFALARVEGEGPSLGGARLERFGGGETVAKFDLDLSLVDDGGVLAGGLTYSTALFDPETAARMARHLETLLESMAADPERHLSAASLLREGERAQLLAAGRGEARPFPGDVLVHQVVAARAAAWPDAPAVACGGSTLGYRELHERAARLAGRLRARRVGPEAIVAVLLDRSAELAVSLLAVLQAGGAFVPLDPAYPAGRLAYLLEDSGAAVVLTRAGLAGALPAGSAAVVCVDEEEEEPAGRADFPGVGPDALAYLIYTSGSTGRPKGAMVGHRSLLCYAEAMRERMGLAPGDRVLQFASPAFDVMIEEVFPAWLSGACVVFPQDDLLGSPQELLRLLERERVSVVELPTAFWHEWVRTLAEEGARLPSSLRLVLMGGERVLAERLEQWAALGVPLLHVFGLTETTVTTTTLRLEAGEDGSRRSNLPLGVPLANAEVHVLDGTGEPVPPGVAGEMYIGGAAVARGYHARPALTAERYVPDPFPGEPGARLYRTGDRVRRLADGSLEFLGRMDQQVKLRGYRIEPGEIEAALREHPAVREAVVVVREDAPGDRRLVGYVVAEGETVSPGELREHLGGRVPEHMVPGAFVALDRVPLTANGKLDRRALPAPEWGVGEEGYVAPRTPTEEVLAGIWGEVLGTERVGVGENFFDLGGHSLLATRVVSRIRQVLAVELPLRGLFEAPTVAGLAERVEALRRAGLPVLPPVLPTERGGALPLSFAQERLWFLDRLEPGSAVYNIPVAWRLVGTLHEAALERALGEIVRRHEALRTVFAGADGSPVQVIAPFGGFALPVEDLSGLGEADREAALGRRAGEEARRAFDLAAGPLFRATLLRLGAGDHVLLLSMHHIVSDGWSMGVLRRELSALYAAYREGRKSPLAELAVQYGDYALWQREHLRDDVLEGELAYWRERLADAPALLELPTDHPRPAVQSFRGASERVQLPPEVVARLRALGRQEGATLYMVALGAFQALLCRYSGSEDVVVGSPIAGRGRGEVEELIGFFVNTLVLRTDVSGDPSLRELLGRVREVTLGAYEHQEVPFERLVAELSPDRSLGHSPLFQVAFTLDAQDTGGELAGLSAQGVAAELAVAKFDLSLELVAGSDGVRGKLTYGTDLWEAATMQRLVGHFTRLVEQAGADPDVRISQVMLLDEAEHRQVVEEWNRTSVEYPTGACIHELVAAQAERTPQALAVVSGQDALTYHELDARADRLARRIAGLGAGPEVRVGICLERSAGLVVAILAVLKAGAAYLPLDPAYPADRLAYMLADSGARVLVTQASHRGFLPVDGVRIVLVDADAAEDAAEPDVAPRTAVAPESAAYVIYTSGSTGRPKGVLVQHGSLANLLAATREAFGVARGDVMPALASYAFDIWLFETLLPLTSGAAVRLVERDRVLDVPALLEEIADATLVHAVPALMRQVVQVERERPRLGRLRRAFVGGDRVAADLLADMRATLPRAEAHVLYGPTEGTILASAYAVPAHGVVEGHPIGAPLGNVSVYVCDALGSPQPAGVPGELLIGGAGVARGYLGRAALTAERFVPDPFGGRPGARLYRTGDRARRRTDGTLEYLGRLDAQVKVRGFRIEPGEIEGALRRSEGVADCVVVAREDVPGEKRLVAYVVGEVDAGVLREHLRRELPEHMVPAAFVPLERLPLTPSGKLDRRALPAPEEDAYARRSYEAPLGEVETALAGIWAEVLAVGRVGRWDHFFELGGHSLLAIKLIERMRRVGLYMDVRALFTTPVLAELALAVGRAALEVEVPANRIPEGCASLTPEMLPLVELSQAEIDRIVAGVPGGAANVQDVYPLAPLQEGILFHHLLSREGDPYLQSNVAEFDTRARLEQYLAALQAVIDRHDVLRTAMAWEGLREPVQVVWRHAPLPLEEVELDAGPDAAGQLWRRYDPRQFRMDLRRAPLRRACVAEDRARGRWLLLMLTHHLTSDHESLEVMQEEISAHLRGLESELPAPLPFRGYVAQARLGVSREEHERFFRGMLGDVDEPTAPYGLLDVWGEGRGIGEARLPVAGDLGARLRRRARALGVSAASLCHLAWAQVLARLSGRTDVVFGTLLFGRMQGGEGADRVMGPFINTLPVRIGVGEEGVEAAVRRTHVLLADLLRHEHASLALAQRSSGVAAPAPLFTSLLNYRYSGTAGRSREAGQPGEGGRDIRAQERTNYPVVLAVDDLGEEFSLAAQVAAPAEAERVCRMMHTALERLVEVLELAPGRAAGSIDVLPEAERAHLVRTSATPALGHPRLCLHELFARQAARTPDRVALVHRERTHTYAEVERRSTRLAHLLRRRGVGPEVRVGLYLERGPELVLAVLGILKAGGAYVPLDPAYPAERLAYTLADSGASVLVTQSSLPPVSGYPGEILRLDREPDVEAGPPPAPPSGVEAGNAAYVVYTSGSTGRPKGVVVEHASLTSTLLSTRDTFGLGADEVFPVLASQAFDIWAFEVFAPLLAGGRVHLLERETARDVERLSRELAAFTAVHAVPALMQEIVRHVGSGPGRLPGMRHVFIGGDAIAPGLLEAVQEVFPAAQVWAMYGPTEGTIISSATPLRRGARYDWQMVGRPLPGVGMYVCDAGGELLPEGVPGELLLQGAGVARGYLGEAGRTAERFIPDPFSAEGGARLYRTGDRVRRRADGELEFLGRVDQQVKIRGFRIELGEVETVLAEVPGVREAVVVARAEGPGDVRLVAYWVGEAEVGADRLRAHLSERLPEYMVPAAFVPLERLPLTPNGKLDRRALPAPEGDAYARRSYEAPLGEVETALAGIWAEVLAVGRVGRWDHFFELGGHSLLAIRLIERMRRVGLYMDVRALFTTPVLAELALAVGRAALEVEVPANRIPEGCASLTPEMLPLVELSQAEIDRIVAGVPGGAANVQDVYPLAPLQEGILFHHLLSREGDPYLQSNVAEFDTRARLEQYLAALQAVIDRHDVLRTAMAWEGLREPVQVVWRHAPLPLEEVELDAGPDAAGQLWRRYDPRQFRMDLRRAPLRRACVAEDRARGRWLLLMLTHHLTSDHESLEVMQEEISAHLRGLESELPAPLPFRGYVAQARLGVSREEHERFFCGMLGDVEEPTAPFGLLDVRGDGSGIEQAQLDVEGGLAARLRERARALGVSAATVCHVAWAQVLARASGRDDVVFGTVLFGRMQGGEGADRVMGPFINTLPVRVRVGRVEAAAGVRETHALLAKLLRHEHASLVLAQRCSAVDASAPLFTSLLNYRYIKQKAPSHAFAAAAPPAGTVVQDGERSNYPLTLSVDDLGEGFLLAAQAPASVQPLRVCELMHAALESLVQALETAPGAALGGLGVLPEGERRQVLEEWNATEAEYPGESCVHGLFEARVERTPDAVAVVHEDRSLTYAELNARANRLAHHLRALGVGPGARVAILVPRSIELVVAELAILKAGAAYVPIDPSFPPERIAFMVADSGSPLVLSRTGADLSMLPGVERVDVDALPEGAGHDPRVPLHGGAPAYVMYTSGSTGEPKGVVVPHRAIVRLVVHNGYADFGPDDRVAFAANPAFDASTLEVWAPLLGGGRIVVIGPEVLLEPRRFAAALARHEVDVLWMSVGLFNQYAEELKAEIPRLRYLIVGGDALDPQTIARVLEGYAPRHLLNGYGPTETTTFAITHEVTDVEQGAGIPLGRPIANTRIYILDAHGEPVPVGVGGELYIGGAGVALGYHERPGLTAERFVPDPFGGEPRSGARMYRTGDLGRWLPDGTVEFLGRNDHQVKVRGFRIELGEIEARLLAHPEVREAAVLAREDAPGDRRLVAYYVGAEGAEAEKLRAHLAGNLPEYMVPAAYVRLEKLPLNPNGKVDRRALPAPEGSSYATREYEAPRTPVEEVLAGIWTEVLSRERVGVHDSFFDLGGHSLLIIRLLAEIQATFDLEISMRTVFSMPTLEAMAGEIERRIYEDVATMSELEAERLAESNPVVGV